VPVPTDTTTFKPLPALNQCEYAAFVSYAHADDELAFGWVSQFRTELERGLRALLRGIPVPRLHLSAENGPIAGALGAELSARIERSFAMIIVVHLNYAASAWCLKELEAFRSLFGEAGLKQRLYVLALSEPAMLQVAAGATWQGLMAGDDAVWLPFHERDDAARPIAPYTDAGTVSQAFRAPFERLRDDLGAKMKAAQTPAGLQRALPEPPPPVAAPAVAVVDMPLPLEGTPVPVPVPLPAAGAGSAPTALRIYIESNRHERTLWEPLGEQIQRQWSLLCAHLAPDRVPPLSLRARGLPVDQLEQFPTLDDADGVVLLWGRKTSDTLVAQIDKVERKTSPGRDAPPGIVAYLMPPQQASEPVPAWGWQVLRFDVRDEDAVDVLDEEQDQLTRFLKKVFRRRVQREEQGR
jgi:TIR domain